MKGDPELERVIYTAAMERERRRLMRIASRLHDRNPRERADQIRLTELSNARRRYFFSMKTIEERLSAHDTLEKAMQEPKDDDPEVLYRAA